MLGRVITTVVGKATSYDLVDLDELKEDLQILTDADNGFLERAISRASAAAAQYCNRVFVVETVTDQVLGSNGAEPWLFQAQQGPLQLSRYPIVSPTQVIQDDVPTVSNPITVVEAGNVLVLGTDFVVNAALGQLIRLDGQGCQSAWSDAGIVVTYAAGYDPIPYDVADAVTRLVKGRVASRTRDPLLRSETIPGVSSNTYWVGATADAGNLPPDVADALDQYRVVVIA